MNHKFGIANLDTSLILSFGCGVVVQFAPYEWKHQLLYPDVFKLKTKSTLRQRRLHSKASQPLKVASINTPESGHKSETTFLIRSDMRHQFQFRHPLSFSCMGMDDTDTLSMISRLLNFGMRDTPMERLEGFEDRLF